MGETVLSPAQADVARSLYVGGPASERALLDQFGYRTLTTLAQLRVVGIRRAGGLPALYHITPFGRELLRADAESENDNTHTITGGTTMNATTTAKPDPKPSAKRPSGSKKQAEKKQADPVVEPETDAAAKPADDAASAEGTPQIQDVTGKPPAPKPAAAAHDRKPLPAATEKKVVEAVTAVVPADHDFHPHAIRYGRKIAKKHAGLRASSPPLAGLSKETAEKVSAAVLAAL